MKDQPHIVQRYLKDTAGAVMVYVTLIFSVLIGLVALATDFALAYRTDNHLQVTADAAALAGASQMADETQVKPEATLYAKKNYPDAADGTSVIKDSDIIIGNWDGTTFDPAGTDRNAVQVTTRRSAANGNAMPTVISKVLGYNSIQLEATAVAWADPGIDECFQKGLVAAGIIEMGSTNTLDGVCMHGENGAKISSDNIFTNANLSMPDLDNLEASSPNPGIEDALEQRSLPPEAAMNIDGVLSDILNGTGPEVGYLTGAVESVNSLPNNPTTGTLYIVDGDVTLSGNVNGFGVYSTKKITISSDAYLGDLFLAAEENVEAGSSVQFGSLDFCSTGIGEVFIAAKDEVKFGSNNSFTGTQIIAGNYLDMGSNLQNIAGMAAQSGGDIKFGSATESGCDNTEYVLFFDESPAVILKLVH